MCIWNIVINADCKEFFNVLSVMCKYAFFLFEACRILGIHVKATVDNFLIICSHPICPSWAAAEIGNSTDN